MRSAKVPCLEVCALDGQKSVIELRGERLSVGRRAPGSEPDLALDPDPQRWVGRLHCMLEFELGTWWLTDNGTVNGTLLRRGDQTERVQGQVDLQDGDVILILGAMNDDGKLLYWQLIFSDPHSTKAADRRVVAGEPAVAEVCLEYDWVQAKVYRCEGGKRTEVSGLLRPRAHQLIRYMAEVSRKNGGVPVVCSHEDLIRALWGEPEQWPKYRSYTRADLADVVADVRKKIEPDRQNPRLLETVPRIGYRLIVCEGKR